MVAPAITWLMGTAWVWRVARRGAEAQRAGGGGGGGARHYLVDGYGLGLEGGQADGEGLHLAGLADDQWPEEVVPVPQEDEDAQRGQHRADQREDDHREDA